MFSLKVIDGNGRTIAVGRDEEEVNLMVARENATERTAKIWFFVFRKGP